MHLRHFHSKSHQENNYSFPVASKQKIPHVSSACCSHPFTAKHGGALVLNSPQPTWPSGLLTRPKEELPSQLSSPALGWLSPPHSACHGGPGNQWLTNTRQRMCLLIPESGRQGSAGTILFRLTDQVLIEWPPSHPLDNGSTPRYSSASSRAGRATTFQLRAENPASFSGQSFLM